MAALITQATAKPVRVDLFVPFKVAYGATLQAELTIVELKDDQGNIGLGECAPASYLSAEEKSNATIVASDLCASCQGLSVESALLHLQSVKSEVFNKAAIAYIGVETALWDLRSRSEGRSLAETFGGAKRQTVETDITLPLLEISELDTFWNIMKPIGFRTVKIKVSGNLTEDIERMQEFLAIAPKDIEIFLDGNQGFERRGAEKLIEKMTSLKMPKPLFFEQPLPKDDWQQLKKLSANLSIPVCLDETIATISDVERCVRDKVASMINLKIMKSGISETLAIAKIAASSGLTMMIGGMVESEITMTASLQMMSAFPEIKYADLDTPFFLKKRLCKTSAWHGNSARLKIDPEARGLGLELQSKRSDA